MDDPAQAMGQAKSLVSFLLLARMEALQFVLAVLTITWGMWVTSDFGTVFQIPIGVLPESLIGPIMFVVGVLQLLGFALAQYRTHLVTTFLSGLGWFYIAVAFVLATDFHSSGIPVYSVLFLASSWCVVRLTADHATAGRRGAITTDEEPVDEPA